MFFVALATDYDDTLTEDGRVQPSTLQALEDVRRSGRKLILVTGRELDDLQRCFSHLDLFHMVVAENGGLLFDPVSRKETPLGEPPSEAFVQRLRDQNVAPLSVGRTIVATREPHHTVVLQAVHDFGLELHIIFNKGAVMVLPSNINKASGLRQALKHLGLSAHNIVAIGDAENDQAFLAACGCGVAVGNALPALKEKADLVLSDRGAGVIELARMLVDTDLADPGLALPRKRPVLGEAGNGRLVHLSPFETTLIAGSSGAGKSTVVTALLEEMRERGFQFCVVDPEGDYGEFPEAAVVGDVRHEPRPEEVMRLLNKPEVCVVVNLTAIDPSERPRFLGKFLPELAKLRAETGRPHWIVLDEAHHGLPAEWDPAPVTLPKELPAAIAVTVHPEEVSRDFLQLVSTVIGVGDGAAAALAKFWEVTGRKPAAAVPREVADGQLLVWHRDNTVDVITPRKPKERQKRHARKYAEGTLDEARSFYFRGPRGALNLRAQNLSTFLQLAAGVDERTWLHHLRAGEYSRWFRTVIKDEELAAEAQAVERDRSLSATESRARIREVVERRYTAPAKTSR